MERTLQSLFRDYSPSDSLRSDRSARDRQRHIEKVRQSIRKNLADIVAEEAIIGQDKGKKIKVPIRGVKEYRFIYGENTPGVGQGDGNSEPGQIIGRSGQQGEGQGEGSEKAGDQAGVDYYETEITLEELIQMMFEDLQLPNMERKVFQNIESERLSKRKGYRKAGIIVRLDKKKTAIKRIKRRLSSLRHDTDETMDEFEQDERFPFHKDDMTYKHLEMDVRPQSNAVVICIMDTSGSMDTMKKYLARSFFFLLSEFVRTKYQNVEIVFVAHHTEGKEVTEEEFFHKGESGGTFISSGYAKVLEIIADRYSPDVWNVYAFHCSDGDNSDSDNGKAMGLAQQLEDNCNLFGYGEIKPNGTSAYESSMIQIFKNAGLATVLIQKKEDIWPAFKEFLSTEKVKEAA